MTDYPLIEATVRAKKSGWSVFVPLVSKRNSKLSGALFPVGKAGGFYQVALR